MHQVRMGQMALVLKLWTHMLKAVVSFSNSAFHWYGGVKEVGYPNVAVFIHIYI